MVDLLPLSIIYLSALIINIIFLYSLFMGETGETLTGKVVDTLASATADNHDARTDPAQTAADTISSEIGGDKILQEEVKGIVSDLARKAQGATYVNPEGVGQPSKIAAGLAEIDMQIAQAKARKRASQTGDKTNSSGIIPKDPMAESAERVLSQPWESTKE